MGTAARPLAAGQIAVCRGKWVGGCAPSQLAVCRGNSRLRRSRSAPRASQTGSLRSQTAFVPPVAALTQMAPPLRGDRKRLGLAASQKRTPPDRTPPDRTPPDRTPPDRTRSERTRSDRTRSREAEGGRRGRHRAPTVGLSRRLLPRAERAPLASAEGRVGLRGVQRRAGCPRSGPFAGPAGPSRLPRTRPFAPRSGRFARPEWAEPVAPEARVAATDGELGGPGPPDLPRNAAICEPPTAASSGGGLARTHA